MWGQPRGGSIPLARTITFPPGDRGIDVIGLTEGSTKWELILASGSPRRRELLSEAGLSFQIISPDVDELSGDGYSPRDLALTNARLKCMAVSVVKPEAMVIGADTVVTLSGKIYGKPIDLEEAAQNLRVFSGRIHEVLTGVVLSCGDQRAEFVSTSFVKFRELGELDIKDYLSKVHVLDKAGGYAAQEHRELIIEKFEGDYQNIIGLPVSLVLDHLYKMGFPIPASES
jgi:septum formation protein